MYTYMHKGLLANKTNSTKISEFDLLHKPHTRGKVHTRPVVQYGPAVTQYTKIICSA